jgi:hypothetical protein
VVAELSRYTQASGSHSHRRDEGEHTDVSGDRIEAGVVGERDQKAFHRSDESWEGEDLEISLCLLWRSYRPLFIFSTLPENMLHQGVENSSNPK